MQLLSAKRMSYFTINNTLTLSMYFTNNKMILFMQICWKVRYHLSLIIIDIKLRIFSQLNKYGIGEKACARICMHFNKPSTVPKKSFDDYYFWLDTVIMINICIYCKHINSKNCKVIAFFTRHTQIWKPQKSRLAGWLYLWYDMHFWGTSRFCRDVHSVGFIGS